MDEQDKHSNFLTELSRRRVFRSAAAYIVIAWAIVEVGSIVLPEFGAPAWSMRALLILLIVGFPPAMLLAWALDVSTKGINRTPEASHVRVRGRWPRVTTFVIATAMSGTALWWVWDDYIVQPGEQFSRPAIKSQPVIAVNSPRQRIGLPENAWIGDGVANLIRSELADSRHVIVISQSRWDSLSNEVTSADGLTILTRDLGVDYLIDGEFIETPDGIVLTLFIEDLEAGTQIQSSQTREPDAAGVIASVPEHITSIQRALRIPHTESVGAFGADFAIDNVGAYEAYIAGLIYWNEADYLAAESAFNAALEAESDYQIARLRLAQMYEELGQSELAWRTIDSIPDNSEMSERLRLYIAGAKTYFVAERNPQSAVEAYSRLVQTYPYEFEARLFLSESYWLNFQDAESIVQARRLTELHDYDPNSWKQLGKRLIGIGDLPAAKIALDKCVSLQPSDATAHSMLGVLAQLQGDLDASVRHHQVALEVSPGFAKSTIGLASSRFLQGNINAARSLWQSVIDNEENPTSDRISAVFNLAGVLRGRGLYDEAVELYADSMPLMEEEGRRNAMALSQLATTEIAVGNFERARARFEESLGIAPPPVTRYLFAKGLAELQLGRFDVVNALVEEILEGVTGDNMTSVDAIGAANYLNGLSALEQNDLVAAETHLTVAVDGLGYRYAIYELGLAKLYKATSDAERAREMAEFAYRYRGSGDYGDADNLRLDLELDRSHALLLLAEILAEQGANDESIEYAREFRTRWQNAPANLPEIIRANELIGGAR